MSESNGTPQNPTLSVRQRQVLGELLAGSTITAAAEVAGVDRTTIHQWMQQSTFLAELEAGRERIYHAMQTRILTLASTAIAVVEKSLTEDEDPKAALDVLKLVYRGRSEIDLTVHKPTAELDAQIEQEISRLRSTAHNPENSRCRSN